MACIFEHETDCCATCGASLQKFRRAGLRCRAGDGRVVHLDRTLAIAHLRRQTALVAALEVEAARVRAAGPVGDGAGPWDLYETGEPPRPAADRGAGCIPD